MEIGGQTEFVTSFITFDDLLGYGNLGMSSNGVTVG